MKGCVDMYVRQPQVGGDQRNFLRRIVKLAQHLLRLGAGEGVCEGGGVDAAALQLSHLATQNPQ